MRQHHFCPVIKGDFSSVHLHTPPFAFLKGSRNSSGLRDVGSSPPLTLGTHMIGSLQVIQPLQTLVIFSGGCTGQYSFSFTEMSWGLHESNGGWGLHLIKKLVSGSVMCFDCIMEVMQSSFQTWLYATLLSWKICSTPCFANWKKPKEKFCFYKER